MATQYTTRNAAEVSNGPAAALETFPWPIPRGASSRPVWTGHGFEIGTATCAVLSYQPGDSNWSEELTDLHEAVAGATHPIDAASRELALAALGRSVHVEDPVILEVGCSSGYFLAELKAANPDAAVIGSDFIRKPLERLAKRMPTVPLLQFDLVQCPFPDECVDGVVALNVLEHIEDDRSALEQIHRILRPGGVAVLEVPAGQWLYDSYDRFLMHWRRYSRRELVDRCRAVGLKVECATHLGVLIFPAFAIVKLSKRRALMRHEEEGRLLRHRVEKSRTSTLMRALTAAELWMHRTLRWPMPFGIRCVVTARRPTR